MLARNLAYHRRSRLEDVVGGALDEVDRQIEERRSEPDKLQQSLIPCTEAV